MVMWQKVQAFFDVQGDAIMFFYTVAVVWKTLHGGLDNADAAAYATAIGALGYSKGAKNVKN